MQRSPDSVCEEYGRKVCITVRTLEGDEDMILVEADREGLAFLGKLFLAQAAANDCSFQISPNGAGKAFFHKDSTKGIYIHRLHPAAANINPIP